MSELRPLDNMTMAEKKEELRILKQLEKIKHKNIGLTTYQNFYPFQRKFNATTKDNVACLLMAANQCITANTKIGVIKEKVQQSVPFLETLTGTSVHVQYWADGSIHDTDIYRAYFQGIFPTVRLHLSNGQFLDCTGEHKVLTDEGNYRTILSLMSDEDDCHYYQKAEDYQANYVGDDYQCDPPLPQALNNAQALLQLLNDVQQHSQQHALLAGVAAHIDQYSLISQCNDLLSSSDDLDLILDLIDKFSSYVVLPNALQSTCLHLVSEQLLSGIIDLPQLNVANDLNKIFCCGELDNNRIFFPRPIPLKGASIIAYQSIGYQPCFDYQIPDHHNYVSAGIISHNCGKSLTGCIIDAFHLTGEYPDDWEGYKFTAPPLVWLLGYSGEKTRDLLQTKLFGKIVNKEFTGGYIPKDKILSKLPMTGTPQAMREVRVKHVSGTSTCQFWSYSQGQHAIMGDVVDWYHIDEEPKDPKIYPQVITRTLNGDQGRGGRGILTFTPENGKTELVCQFMDQDIDGQKMSTATWDDAPHMTKEKKERTLALYPAYQREMRSKGTPLMGAGLIFEVSEEYLYTDPFDIPNHWFVINGMDFGWDHPQAHVQLVWDKEADIFYLTQAWKESKRQPYEAWHVVKSWSEGIPTAWPSDGLQTEKGSGKQQMEYYDEAGFDMLPTHATWEDGGNSVWAGLGQLNDLMQTGRFKVIRTLAPFFAEFRQYHTKTTANNKIEIVKINDDLIDAVRYAYMMRRYAERITDLFNPQEHDSYAQHSDVSNVTGC